ncbi:hypothetical protein K438DRAFT_2092412 [Mycena galopus ATCC 62051]|nr:hypothetical protein K438DRAFT_2092412 [Mycena galopus ATCC 62051]
MQAKFASLSVVLSALFVSQIVGAVPNVDCSLVRCAAVKCPLGQTSQIKPGTCCPTCVPCGKVNCPLIRCAPDYISVTQPGDCCPTCVPRPDCSAVQCLACPKNTIAITVPGQCCPTCKPKPDCTDVLCLDCVGEIEPGNCCPTCGLGSPI